MKTVHLMGIGGSGMTSLAGMFKESGWNVRGSDLPIYPPASTELARMNIEVLQGYHAQNLIPKPDLVVVGNVISKDNPEAQALLQNKMEYTSMAQALEKYFLAQRRVVAVTGTHGKTTTTSLLSWILYQAGYEPGYFVGGIPCNFAQSYRIGQGDIFVIEGDEYDTAFFEKTPKFLHYNPCDVIITSIEFDHADIYKDIHHIQQQFKRLVQIIPEHGNIIACGDTPAIQDILQDVKKAKVEFYGKNAANHWRPNHIEFHDRGTNFDIEYRGKKMSSIFSLLLGEHNVLNITACIAMTHALGLDCKIAAQHVSTFQGVRRRQESLGEVNERQLYDDFAHHPTAIRETILAFMPVVKKRKGRLWIVFEPRSNTVRRRVFQNELPESFLLADEVLLAPVYQKKDALTDKDMLQPNEVARAIEQKGTRARAVNTMDEIVEILKKETKPKDVVVFMSNGFFSGVPLRVKQALVIIEQ